MDKRYFVSYKVFGKLKQWDGMLTGADYLQAKYGSMKKFFEHCCGSKVRIIDNYIYIKR